MAAGRRDPGGGAAARPPRPGDRVAAGVLADGIPVVVSGGRDGTVRVWRLADGSPVGEPLRGAAVAGVSAVAGRWVWRTGSRWWSAAARTGRCGCWRLADGSPVGEPLRSHGGGVPRWRWGCCADGTPVVVSGGSDGTVRVWRLATARRWGSRCAAIGLGVAAVAAGALADGTPVVVSGGWRRDGAGVAAGRRRPVGEPLCRQRRRGGPRWRWVRWRMAFPGGGQRRRGRGGAGVAAGRRHPVGEPLRGHDGGVTAVAAGGAGRTGPRWWSAAVSTGRCGCGGWPTALRSVEPLRGHDGRCGRGGSGCAGGWHPGGGQRRR